MLYFAYGSNMDIHYFNKFISKDCIKVIGKAYINNYIFKYRNIKTSKLRSGVANIEKRLHSRTYGIVYYINDNAELKNLDKKEGYYSHCDNNNKYNKIIVQCKLLENNRKLNCFTYQINDKFISYERPPKKEYIKYLINGNRMHNLPKEHLRRINYIFT